MVDKKKTATLRQEGEKLFLNTPFSRDLVEELKEAISWKERKWEPPNWEIQTQHLETVRALVTKYALAEGWELFDHTAQTAESIAEQKQALVEDFIERHVAAVLEVLPLLPKRALRLVEWTPEFLTFELREFLGGDLFKTLAQASLESYRPLFAYGGHHKREFTRTFIVSADARIVRALGDIAGITPWKDTYGSTSGIEYFVVRSVDLVETFEDGVAHFTSEDGRIWVGFPYERDPVDLSHTQEPWQLAIGEQAVYELFQREKTTQRLLGVKESEYINPGIGRVAVASSHPSQVAEFIHMAHLEVWFRTWGNDLVQDDKLTKKFFGKPYWYAFDWEHPANELLSHASSRLRRGVAEMYRLLGWDEHFVKEQRERIESLKESAAQAVIADMRARAAELAEPLLMEKTIKDLVTWGEEHDIKVVASWGKQKIVQTLLADQKSNEDIIGLTKRLEGK